MRMFGSLLNDPNLWHLNRRSAAGAFAVGLFSAFVPIPLQMILAAALAVLFRVNLPISVALVWITNPLTVAPVFYFAYRMGAWLLGHPVQAELATPSVEQLWNGLNSIWASLLLGSFILSSVSAICGYLLIRGLWRLNIVRRWKNKRLQNRTR